MLWGATLVAGILLPGGGIVAAIIASFTGVRRTRFALVGMWVIGGILGFLAFCVFFPFASVTTVGPPTVP